MQKEIKKNDVLTRKLHKNSFFLFLLLSANFPFGSKEKPVIDTSKINCQDVD